MTLDYGNYGIFLIMGNAGFISSTVHLLALWQPALARGLKIQAPEQTLHLH